MKKKIYRKIILCYVTFLATVPPISEMIFFNILQNCSVSFGLSKLCQYVEVTMNYEMITLVWLQQNSRGNETIFAHNFFKQIQHTTLLCSTTSIETEFRLYEFRNGALDILAWALLHSKTQLFLEFEVEFHR